MSGINEVPAIPSKIWVRIILHLNARDRVALADSHQVFNKLIFQKEELLRDLDFSEEGRLTLATDIGRYFHSEKTTKHIQEINLTNVRRCELEEALNYVGKACNLVDLNIQRTEFENIQQLADFLEPLIRIKRLSIDWPKSKSPDVLVLENAFKTLEYFSVRINSFSSFKEFLSALRLCKELKELRIVQENCRGEDFYDFESCKHKLNLGNLQSIQFHGKSARLFKRFFENIIPESEKWINFELASPLSSEGFHLEKNLSVPIYLQDQKGKSEMVPSLDWVELFYETMSSRDIKSTWLCCLQKFRSGDQWLLKINDAKGLLKDPKHPVTYLYLSHAMNSGCDGHIIALAFPTLTELHLSDITRSRNSFQRKSHGQHIRVDGRRLPNYGRPSYVNGYGDSSFKLMVEDLPCIRNLTVDARPGTLAIDEAWDVEALDLICKWRHLQSLRLSFVPIVRGDFLVEIGKRCKKLKKVEFYDLGDPQECCYIKGLNQMLKHCENLREFTIKAQNVGRISEILISLAKNVEVRRVRLILSTSDATETFENLIPAIELLLRSCPRLITFVFIIEGISRSHSEQLTSVLIRLRKELNRPSLQFQVVRETETESEAESVQEDYVPPSFPFAWDGALGSCFDQSLRPPEPEEPNACGFRRSAFRRSSFSDDLYSFGSETSLVHDSMDLESYFFDSFYVDPV